MRPLGRYGLPAAAADRAQSFGLNVDVAGRIAAVTVSGAARRLVDGSAQVPDTVQRIEVVDLMSAARRVVASRGDYAAGSTLIGGYALDGHVYWQVRSPGASGRDRIYDYDAATGRTSLTDLGTFFGLTRSAAGVAWTDASIDRPARLPRLVQAALDRDRTITFSTFVSDGSAWAWATPTGDLAWWSPASGRVVHVRGLLGRGARQPGIPLAVAGPFVWYQPVGGVDGGRIVDVRSGANVSGAEVPRRHRRTTRRRAADRAAVGRDHGRRRHATRPDDVAPPALLRPRRAPGCARLQQNDGPGASVPA